MREPASLELVQSRLQILFPCAKRQNSNYATNHRHPAQLQRLRDKSVKDKTVELAKQKKQICAGYDNNIKALGYLVEKTSAGAAVSVESLKNVSGLQRHPAQGNRTAGAGKTLANIKATRMQKNLTAAACEEK